MEMPVKVTGMATSSITKNFVISGKKQVEIFLNALEESKKNPPPSVEVSVREITSRDEMKELMTR